MESNFLKTIIEEILPYFVHLFEIMGIFIVVWSGFQAFGKYICNTFFGKKYELQYKFANGLAIALEFKMAAEILKTVLIREISELIMLGAVIILRALVTILLRFEMKSENRIREKDNDTKE